MDQAFQDFFRVFGEFVDNLSQQRSLNTKLVQSGWYPSSITVRHKKGHHETIDDFMVRCLTGRFYNQIKEDYIFAKYPERKEIFLEAFKLFEEKRYLACIPMMLSQVDGILIDKGLAGFFLGDYFNGKPNKQKNLRYLELLRYEVSRDPENMLRVVNYYKDIFDFAADHPINKGTSKVQSPTGIGFLNRHGILHGRSEFLKYGTRNNFLKILSLILFITTTYEFLELENSDQ
ncbi:hypothetical protein [Acinetobacter rudis]|uniref:hypothetical protein n=1 Tax=Acinetobacter rudis TaxID=632955 RepID=UPI0033426C08